MSLLNILSRQAKQRHIAANDRKARRHQRLGLEALETRQVMSTFAVTTLADSGSGSLRQAITQADSAPDPASIQFSSALVGTISLKSALPELSNTHGTTINGHGGVTVDLTNAKMSDGNSIRVDSLANVSISNLSFTNAPGRAFENYGTLSLNNDTIQNSHNGAAVNYGTLNLTNSTIKNNTALNYGGGVNNYQGTLNSTNTNFIGNSATYGGAIDNSARMNLSGGSFSGNKATDGGAIHDASSTPSTIDSVTLTGNTAGLGGGLYEDGPAASQVQNSNIHGNHATALGGTTGADVYCDSGVAATSHNNVIGDGAGLWGISDNNNFDRPYVSGAQFNPQHSFNPRLPVNYVGTHALPIAPVMEQLVAFQGTTLKYDYTVRSNSATLAITPGTSRVWLDSDTSNDSDSENNAHYYPNNFAVDLYLADSGNEAGGSVSLWQNYDVLSLTQPSLTITGGGTGTTVGNGLSGVSYTWNGVKH